MYLLIELFLFLTRLSESLLDLFNLLLLDLDLLIILVLQLLHLFIEPFMHVCECPLLRLFQFSYIVLVLADLVLEQRYLILERLLKLFELELLLHSCILGLLDESRSVVLEHPRLLLLGLQLSHDLLHLLLEGRRV